MWNNTLDLEGSREIVERLVRAYQEALEAGDASVILEKREKLARWLYPLACWYLDHTSEDEVEARRLAKKFEELFAKTSDCSEQREKLRRAMMGY